MDESAGMDCSLSPAAQLHDSKTGDSGREGFENSRRRRRRGWLFFTVFAVYLIAISELGARLYWNVSEKVPWIGRDRLFHRFYREIPASKVESAPTDRKDDQFDVLLLGGSVLHPDFGSIERMINERLPSCVGRPVRTFNLAGVGRTSRDSLIKYRRLKSKRFDLVVAYDGINDVRMNNCPQSKFRSDYTHCSWYLWIERLERHPEANWFALPYTLEYWAIDALDSIDIGCFVPRHRPRRQWLQWGAEVRTDATLEANLRELSELARERNDPLVLCTFAWHIPPDYSEADFGQRRLDYAGHGMPVEMWGAPANVAAAMRMQNDAIRRLAETAPGALLVDQEALIPKRGEFFDDVCHLTETGCRLFVDNLISAWTSAKSGEKAAQATDRLPRQQDDRRIDPNADRRQAG